MNKYPVLDYALERSDRDPDQRIASTIEGEKRDLSLRATVVFIAVIAEGGGAQEGRKRGL